MFDVEMCNVSVSECHHVPLPQFIIGPKVRIILHVLTDVLVQFISRIHAQLGQDGIQLCLELIEYFFPANTMFSLETDAKRDPRSEYH